MEQDKEYMGLYWICEGCAKAQGWTLPEGCLTVVRGLCGHCKSPAQDILIPTVDFKKGPDHEPVWD